MAFLKRLVMGSPKAPLDPSDEVLPAFWHDNNPLNRDSMLSWTLRFNQVLDPDKLHNSLSRLIAKDGWRKLGGRMRVNRKNGIEFHVPLKFSAERSAVNYFQDAFDIGLAEHPVACKLPDPACSKPTVFTSGPGDFLGLALPPGSPRTLNDLLAGDIPALTLYIVSFTDETLVSISWNHVVSDAMGMSDLARAWSLVLAGRDDEVVPMVSGSTNLSTDPMSRAGTDPRFANEKYVLAHKFLSGVGFFRFIMRIILDVWWWPRTEYRTILLPAQGAHQLKKQAAEGLTAGSYVSTGDAITAWLACIAASVLGPGSRRSVSLLNIFDVRGRVPSLFAKQWPEEAAYVQNMTFPTITLLNAQELLAGPVAFVKVARKLREAIVTQTTEGQIHAMARLARKRLDDGSRLPALVAETDSLVIVVSNWTRADFFKAFDFGPAVGEKKPGGDANPCHPVYYHSQANSRFFFCLSGTADGKYWIDGNLPPALWPVIEEELAKLV